MLPLDELSALDTITLKAASCIAAIDTDTELQMIFAAKSAGTPRVLTHHMARIACLALAAWMLAGCHRAPAEQQIREAIDAAATAARTSDTQGVLAVVSKDFSGNAGEMDRHGLRQLLAVRALRQDKTGVLIGPFLSSTTATASSRSSIWCLPAGSRATCCPSSRRSTR